MSWYPLEAWPNLNPHFQAMTSSVMVITGVPGHGKSKFGTHLLLELAAQYDHRIAYNVEYGLLVWRPNPVDTAVKTESLKVRYTEKPDGEKILRGKAWLRFDAQLGGSGLSHYTARTWFSRAS